MNPVPGDIAIIGLATGAAEALADAGYGDAAKQRGLRIETVIDEGNVPGTASRLNVPGPRYSVTAAGDSAVLALHLAVSHLRENRCDIALVGGMLPSAAQSTTMAVLESLETAERTGDRVYAIISAPERMSHLSASPTTRLVTPRDMAGIVQAIGSLHEKVAHSDIAGSNGYVSPPLRPWIQGTGTPRRLALQTSDSDTRLLLEEYTGLRPALSRVPDWDSELVVITGDSRAEMLREAESLLESLSKSVSPSLKDLAQRHNLVEGLSSRSARLAIVAASVDDLRQKLARAIERLSDERVTRIRAIEGIYYFSRPQSGKVALVFPGEGAQYTDMLADLCVYFPEVRRAFDLMDRAFADHPRGYVPSESIFPPAQPGARAAADRLFSMDGGAEAVFAANYALFTLLRNLGIEADAMSGQSIGEHSALLAAGVVRIEDDDEFVRHVRGVNHVFEAIKNSVGIPQATLLTVSGADHVLLEQLVTESGGELHIALDNCPHQVVICGSQSAVDDIARELTGKGAICQKPAFARAYHTPWFEIFNEPLRQYFDSVTMDLPHTAVYSSITAARYPDDPDQAREIISTSWAATVRFREAVQAMYQDGVRIFIEAGPRGNLTGFIDDVLRGKPYVAVPANLPQRSAIQQLHHMLAQLVAHGVHVNLAYLYERRGSPLSVRAAVDAPHRSIILQHHLQTMSRFLEVEREVMCAYLREMPVPGEPTVAAPISQEPVNRPFITEILEITPRARARVRCRLSLDRDRLLNDYTLGRRISDDDPDLSGLAMAPFALLMELLAETASLIRPAEVLAGIRDLNASRWITFEQPVVTLEITAEQRGPEAVHVTLRDGRSEEPLRPIWAEGTMLFGPQYPPGSSPHPLVLVNERHSRWTSDRLYMDGLFQGPAFQMLRAIDRTGENGATATLETAPRNALLSDLSDPGFLLDPVLLDAATQVMFAWSQEQLDPTADVFPFRLDALDCFGPPPEPFQTLECRAAVTRVTDQEVHSNIEIVDQRGNVLYRIHNWEARRFSHAPEFWQLRTAPQDAYLSDQWNEPLAAWGSFSRGHHRPLVCCRLDSFSREFFESWQNVWRKTLAYLVLSRRERDVWMAMRAVDKRRHEWLLGRCAAKDAVRLLLERHLGVRIPPADIEIVPDPYGRPQVEGAWTKRLHVRPCISISHSHGTAVALAALDPGQLIGIDLESLDQQREGFETIAFSPDERLWLAGMRKELRHEWALRLWCAKESVGKALGRGVSAGLQAFHVTDAEISTGVVQLELREAALDQFPQMRGKPVIAYTAREMDFVFSTIIYQQGAVQ